MEGRDTEKKPNLKIMQELLKPDILLHFCCVVVLVPQRNVFINQVLQHFGKKLIGKCQRFVLQCNETTIVSAV